jgi:hypothetical protein
MSQSGQAVAGGGATHAVDPLADEADDRFPLNPQPYTARFDRVRNPVVHNSEMALAKACFPQRKLQTLAIIF